MGKQVKTYSGKTEDSSNCKFILGHYYIKGIECFYIDGQWYRINSPNLYKDHETGSHITKKQYIQDLDRPIDKRKFFNGIVGFKKDGDPVLGYFTSNKSKNYPMISLENRECTRILNSNVLEKGNFVFKNGIAVERREARNGQFGNPLDEIPGIDYIKRNFPYRAAQILFDFMREYKKHKKNIPLNVSNKDLKYANLLKYTFGVEIETDNGAIPEPLLYQLGLMGLRDGSIRGIEYATIPYSGIEGVVSLGNTMKAIKEYTKVTNNNSLHIHLGGFPRRKSSIASLYSVLYRVQNEMYSYFPTGYINTREFKQRDYCSPLPQVKAGRGSDEAKIESRFNSFYEWISGGEYFSGFSTKEHPQDRSGDHKWQVEYRYRWVNLVSLLFGTRGTVEFRIHNPTIDSGKVINWLFICNAILLYAEKRGKTVINSPLTQPLKLSEILDTVYPEELSNELKDYMKWKAKEHLDHSELGDVSGVRMLNTELKGKFKKGVIDV